MAKKVNRQIILLSRPEGMPELSNFKLVENEISHPNEGEVLIKTLYLSVDPYMRGRMKDQSSYISPFQLNSPLTGYAVGKVIETKDPSLKIGDIVKGHLDWADYSIAKGQDIEKIHFNGIPLTMALDLLGMPGMTAYFGLLDIGQPKSGETVVISGAAGAVGSAVGQIAKIKGCRTVGIAGSDDKVDSLVKEMGFDAAINYKKPHLFEELKKACPQGVDIYFDNVGGEITDQVMNLINIYARIVICGQISRYNLEKPDVGPRHFMTLLLKSALAKGFVITRDYLDRFPEGMKQMAQWIQEGKIKNKETIVEGIEKAPQAFIGLFKGENIGKQLVKIED
jgi:NADPH-dependent curcumin reductase CurA